MRARTVLIVEALYILGICGLAFLGFLVVSDKEETPGWELGSGLFRQIVWIQAFLMFFVGPLVAASAVSGEKEQKTYDSLCATPVSFRRIIATKLLASLSVFWILILVSLPFACTSFILGGVSPADVAAAYALTFLCTCAAGAMGLYWSTRFERSIASIPAAAVSSVVVMALAGTAGNMGFTALTTLAPQGFLGMLFERATIPFFGADMAFWIPATGFMVGAFLYLTVAAAGRMEFPSERRYGWQRAIGLLLFAGLVACALGERAAPQQNPAEARSAVSGCLGLLLGLLGVSALWIGANIPVPVSNTGTRRRRSVMAQIVTSGLTHPGIFTALLAATGAAFLAWALWRIGPLNLPSPVVWLAYAGSIGLSTLTWALLALRLADRRTVRGRFVGFAVASVVAGSLILAPFVSFTWLREVKRQGVPPAVQYLATLSPATAVEYIGNPTALRKAMPAVVRRVGPHAPVAVSTGFYLLTAAALLLPVYPSGRRLHRKAQAP
jgi:ABC-type transport system involved in multi-copper enzyme maturation permease subunit